MITITAPETATSAVKQTRVKKNDQLKTTIQRSLHKESERFIMAINSKRKGANGEREIAKILKGYGHECRRTAQYNGKEQGSLADVVGLPGYHIEVKRVESGLKKMDDFMEQAVRECQGEVPTVWHRRNNKGWLVTMRLEDWMEKVCGGRKNAD